MYCIPMENVLPYEIPIYLMSCRRKPEPSMAGEPICTVCCQMGLLFCISWLDERPTGNRIRSILSTAPLTQHTCGGVATDVSMKLWCWWNVVYGHQSPASVKQGQQLISRDSVAPNLIQWRVSQAKGRRQRIRETQSHPTLFSDWSISQDKGNEFETQTLFLETTVRLWLSQKSSFKERTNASEAKKKNYFVFVFGGGSKGHLWI
jgi:hypothetical protein